MYLVGFVAAAGDSGMALQAPMLDQNKASFIPHNNIWAYLTAWINKQALRTLNPPHSITLTPPSSLPSHHSEGCILLVWDWHISTDSVHPIN